MQQGSHINEPLPDCLPPWNHRATGNFNSLPSLHKTDLCGGGHRSIGNSVPKMLPVNLCGRLERAVLIFAAYPFVQWVYFSQRDHLPWLTAQFQGCQGGGYHSAPSVSLPRTLHWRKSEAKSWTLSPWEMDVWCPWPPHSGFGLVIFTFDFNGKAFFVWTAKMY